MIEARAGDRRQAFRDAGLVVALGFAWGLNWSAVRLALHEIPPWTLRGIGLSGGAALIFASFALTGRSAAVPRRDWLRLAVIGLLSVAGFNVLSAFAQLSGPSSRAVILAYTMPLWTVLLARLVLAEPIDRRRRIGLALGAVGLAVLAVPLVRSGELHLGLLYAVGSGVTWAAGSVVLKRWPVAASPLVITAWQLALSAVVVSIVAFLIEGWPPRLPIRPETWFGLAFNLVIGQAVATSLWFAMVEVMPVGIASIASLLVPAVGVVGTTLILGERPTATDWLGLALIVAASASVVLRPGSGAGHERAAASSASKASTN